MNEEEPCSQIDCDAYEQIGPALDRFQEAHYWIHMLERHYHDADQFRWYLNVYLKATKEVPSLISMSLQNTPGFASWYKPKRSALNKDPLLGVLSKRRDYVVHQGMLKLHSSGSVGISRGRGVKLGIGMPIDPLEDSDAAMDRYCYYVSQEGDFFQFLREDEDTLPCVHRTWKLPEFEEEVVELCARAWLRTGEAIAEVLRWLGATPAPLSLSCRHSADRVQVKLFNRDELRARVAELKASSAT